MLELINASTLEGRVDYQFVLFFFLYLIILNAKKLNVLIIQIVYKQHTK